MKNCPNCAAPYDVKLNTCPYCGTSYFDLSAIDFEERKPIYLKIKTEQGIITQRCIPVFGGISMECSYDPYCCSLSDSMYITQSYNYNTDISFIGVPGDNGVAYIFERTGGD